MRLLVITARYPTPDRPGAGHFVRDRLADPALSATVIAPSRYDRPGWLRYLSMTWRALTARGPFDGVEGHFVLPSGVVALLAARVRRLPLVVYAHGSDVRDMARRTALFAWFARRVVRGANAVATNAPETADLVRHLGAEATVIPPGIDLGRFHPTPRPAEHRVLYLGGDVPHKGVELARRLADTLVGPGLREIAPAEVPALIADHDVVLVPSHEEPFGLVAAEAIASGRWVVARGVGGLRTIVTDGVNGSLGATDADLEQALSVVPDYNPQAVASTAEPFSVERHRAGMRALWERVLVGRRNGQAQ